MSAALVRISSLYKALPKAERRVADYVGKYPEEVPFWSVSELAQRANVSIASVSRLAKKLGYENFQSFRIEVARGTADNISTIYEAINEQDSDSQIIEKVFLGNIKSLQDTLRILDRNNLIKAANLLSRARKIVFFGIGGSGNIARDASLRFSHLGVQADAYIDSYQMFVQVLNLGAKDVAIGVSHSGRSKTTVEALGLAQEKRAKTIGISNYLNSPLSKVSDFFFCTSFPESRVRTESLSSRHSQACLMDALYVLVARHLKSTERGAEQLNLITESILRFPEK